MQQLHGNSWMSKFDMHAGTLIQTQAVSVQLLHLHPTLCTAPGMYRHNNKHILHAEWLSVPIGSLIRETAHNSSE